MEKVVITGLGSISALGNNIEEFKRGLTSGQSGIREIKRFDASSYRNVLAGVVENNCDYDKNDVSLQFALDAVMQAINDAKLEITAINKTKLGVAIASSLGRIGQFEKMIRLKEEKGEHDYKAFMNIPHSNIADFISTKYGASGPCISLDTACASGSSIIGYAFDMIRYGLCDVIIAGGTDELSVLSYSGFSGMMNMSRDRCKPFNKNRTGILLGEGCGMVVLESYSHAVKRAADIYCYVCGYGLSNDSYHETQPHPEGKGAEASIRMALMQAGISEEQIDYINGHGTGTKHNDLMEIKVIDKIFGKYKSKIKVSSIKGAIGHTLGAAGAIELVATVIAMKYDFAPPTLCFDEPIEGYEGWDFVPNNSKSCNIKYALSNSFGFAGHCSAIILGRKDNE